MAQQNHTNGELFEKQDTARYGDGPPRQTLFVPRVFARDTKDHRLRGPDWDSAFEILKRWANLDVSGKLKSKKETTLQSEFLTEVFGRALGYTLFSEDKDHWNLESPYAVNGGAADGALGTFRAGQKQPPTVLIELKGPTTNVDRDRARGRTPVGQLWDYLNEQPDCPWGIVCNYVSFRLYHRTQTTRSYQLFILKDLMFEDRFTEFYYTFEREGLLASPGKPSRCDKLLTDSLTRQKEVGADLYQLYDRQRRELIHHLKGMPHNKTLDQAIHIAQKLIDRIIFVAFCEDRGLLPPHTIRAAYTTLPPIQKVTNPRWRNFLDLFQAVDKGNKYANISAFNGGLFEHDELVDDLKLEDNWTDFFNSISGYEFKDEVSVEVLGHLFEKSISDVGQIRRGGLLGQDIDDATRPKMTKSAERKRTGIYYTPPEFTDFITYNVVRQLAIDRFDALASEMKIKRDEGTVKSEDAARAEYWRLCLDILRDVKVVDPACGSGAFLVSAYDALVDIYEYVLYNLDFHEGRKHDELYEKVPDFILHDNLYGVDLSPQAVEIAQLSLWIRSAQQGKTLADLSHNIVCGNSLVADPEIDTRALDWERTFPAVFGRKERGFDCVIGNPPWERMKLQEREYFDIVDTRISTAVNAAERRRLIKKLEQERPEIHDKYLQAKAEADKNLDYVRSSGRYPLTGKGDINTYAVFAELASQIVSPTGRVGLLLQSGIGTEDTTKEFFGSLVADQRLSAVYDFENKTPIFPDVHRSLKFCVFMFGGSNQRNDELDFVFFAHSMDEIMDKSRHVKLSATDIALVNPNTKTLPIFRSQRDAEITKSIYKRVPVLVNESRKEGGNPWGIKFVTMFHQTNDAELFRTAEDLKKEGFKRNGPFWKKRKTNYLPLYEAKMFRTYDHRFGSVFVKKENWVNQGQTIESSLVQYQNPEFHVTPRWWVDSESVGVGLGEYRREYLLSFRDVTRSTDSRTMIATFLPLSGVVNTAPLILMGKDILARGQCCLLGNLNSLPLDFVVKRKIPHIHLNFFVVEQLPLFPPDFYTDKCPWSSRNTLEKWISERVLKLTCTSDDMIPLAEASEFEPPVHP